MAITKPITNSLKEAVQTVLEAANPWKTYERKEDNNDHSENVLHMAKHVGDEKDVKAAKEIVARHNKEGSMYGENMINRTTLHDKLWPRFKAAYAPK